MTEREVSIARLAAAGRSTRAIATELSLSVRSVENHLYALCAKFDVTSTAEFIALVSNDFE